MLTKGQILEVLETVPVPGVIRSLGKMNLVREVKIDDHKVDITLVSAALSQITQEWLKDRITVDITRKLNGVDEASVSFVDGNPKDLNEISHIIAIMSGKGGVGKSLLAGLTAIALRRQGHDVGILDADVTGASIPKMFGINTRPTGSVSGILPVFSRSGIEVMSVNLLLPSEDEAVVWRGPLVDQTIRQFWEEVLWGKLDYLIVDLPPGTADVPLTVMQMLPIMGIIMVFTPQGLTTMIVRKALNMAQRMGKPILGVVENMGYLYVPEIDKKIELFGPSRAEEIAKAAHAPILGRLPIDPALAKLCDDGDIESYDGEIVARLGQFISEASRSSSKASEPSSKASKPSSKKARK